MRSSSGTTFRDSPRPKRESLQLQRRRLDVAPECDDAYYHANDVHHVIAISGNIANATSLNTSVFLLRKRA